MTRFLITVSKYAYVHLYCTYTYTVSFRNSLVLSEYLSEVELITAPGLVGNLAL